MNDSRSEIYALFDQERARQDIKWGSGRHLHPQTWMTILTEEVGESAQEVLADEADKLKTELVQVGAVVVAWLEDIMGVKDYPSS